MNSQGRSISSLNRIAIAGATGFVGQALVERLQNDFQVTGLTRGKRESDSIRWKQADLFSMLDCEKALEGQDIAIYLVHSMLPSAHLVQGKFEDYDLVLADNFAKAAAKCGVKKIIYLGGIIPDEEKLSRHLESRLEVENTLASTGIPLVSVRAGVIIGPGGSSFQIMERLVRRLPIMLCPSWTQKKSAPIYLDNVVEVIAHAIKSPQHKHEVIDVGGKDTITYKQMMGILAKKLGLKRLMFPVPFFSPGLSKLWVSTITGAPTSLVFPLVESLKSEMIPLESRRYKNDTFLDFDEMLTQTMKEKLPVPQAYQNRSPLPSNEVRSIQRIDTPKKTNATTIAQYYFNWLPKFLNPFIKVKTEGITTTFHILGIRKPMLVLEFSDSRSTPDRQLFYIKPSLLAVGEGRGRLEFRDISGGYITIAAIHEFEPRLPWFIYKYSQALLHLWVMHSFTKAVERKF